MMHNNKMSSLNTSKTCKIRFISPIMFKTEIIRFMIWYNVADDYGITGIIASEQYKFTCNAGMVNWCESSHCIFTECFFIKNNSQNNYHFAFDN